MIGLGTASTYEVDRLIERQLRNWELARQQNISAPRQKIKEVEDFVTISRCIGTPGSEIAAKLGKHLRWPVFDREILQCMARNVSYRETLYANLDERDMNWLEEFIRCMELGPDGRNDYFQRLCETVLALARKSHAVFLGRGADLILPQSMGLRVRITARRDHRTRAFAHEYGVKLDEAIEAVNEIEHDRVRFFRHHFRVEEHDPARHDLILNVERFSVDQAVEMILAALRVRGIHDGGDL